MQRMIRLFISSTFKDFQIERDHMVKSVYPVLREHCENHGFSFQVLDLRWGVPIQSAIENRAMQVCLDEIRHCQRLSPDLSFLLMVGERAGWHPVPVRIPKAERADLSW